MANPWASAKSVYLSTDSTATTGSASGTAFPYSSTVYCFVETSELQPAGSSYNSNYVKPDSWTLVGSVRDAYYFYRVGSVVVDSETSNNAITMDIPAHRTGTVTMSKPNYIDTGAQYSESYYLSTNSSATSGSASGSSFNYGDTVYGFVKVHIACTGAKYEIPSS